MTVPADAFLGALMSMRAVVGKWDGLRDREPFYSRRGDSDMDLSHCVGR